MSLPSFAPIDLSFLIPLILSLSLFSIINEDINQMLTDFKKDDSGSIDFDGFLDMMTSTMSKKTHLLVAVSSKMSGKEKSTSGKSKTSGKESVVSSGSAKSAPGCFAFFR